MMDEMVLHKSSLSRDELVGLLRVMTHNLWWRENRSQADDILAPGVKETPEENPAFGFSALSREELESLLATVMDGLWNRTL
jgi:hypothetical protein